MQEFNFRHKNKINILALGAESAGNFSIFYNGKVYFSDNFEDLLNENNFNKFQKEILDFIKKNKIIPDIILSDLHPSMKTTQWGKALAKKFKAQHIQVQHHHAHIFSTIGENFIQNSKFKIQNYSYGTYPVIAEQFYGIAIDGTGYGTDERIWGGEIFKLEIKNKKLKNIHRIGHLENQTLLGGELAIQEPARILLSILSKFLDKKAIYPYMAKFYSRNEFELLYNQLEQNFNCIETSSTGRVLDAVSLLLGFCNNERKYKHAPIDLLEKNSTKPYEHLLPLVEGEMSEGQRGCYRLNTTYLFKYLIENLDKDKNRLAATAQQYLAEGLYKIIKKDTRLKNNVLISGGLSENKIIKNYFISKNIIENKKPHIPRGDAGLSFGQIFWYLFKK